MEETPHRRARWIPVVAVVSSLVVLSAVGVAAMASGDGPADPGLAATSTDGADDPVVPGQPCTDRQRRAALAVEQRRVLELLADVRVLNDEADFSRLAEPREDSEYSFRSHGYTSIAGMGFSIANVGHPKPGQPHLLLYRPNPNAVDVTDAGGSDYPYELVGWGYGMPYTPGQVPNYDGDPGLQCLLPTDWFIHERSIHPYDTWQNIPFPPKEDFPGQVANRQLAKPEDCKPACPGLAHPRLWDVHFWIGESGVPEVSMLNPGPPMPGFDFHVGVGFFYPDPRALGGAAPATPTAGSPDVTPSHTHSG